MLYILLSCIFLRSTIKFSISSLLAYTNFSVYRTTQATLAPVENQRGMKIVGLSVNLYNFTPSIKKLSNEHSSLYRNFFHSKLLLHVLKKEVYAHASINLQCISESSQHSRVIIIIVIARQEVKIEAMQWNAFLTFHSFPNWNAHYFHNLTVLCVK